MSKHKHYDMICQWAADTSREVQYRRRPLGQWTTLDETPLWEPDFEYRFADSVLKYRVALFNDGEERWADVANSAQDEEALCQATFFVRWLTDWTEVTDPPVEKPEPKMKRYERWLNLYNNGIVGVNATPADAETYAGPGRVERRRIEWEVPA